MQLRPEEPLPLFILKCLLIGVGSGEQVSFGQCYSKLYVESRFCCFQSNQTLHSLISLNQPERVLISNLVYLQEFKLCCLTPFSKHYHSSIKYLVMYSVIQNKQMSFVCFRSHV